MHMSKVTTLYALNLCSFFLGHLYLNKAVKMKKVTRLRIIIINMVCTQFSTQRGPSKGNPDQGVCRTHHARHSSLLLDSPCTRCPNQRVTSQTFYCCDTHFRGSLHPVQSLRFGATLSTLVLAELPTVIDFCVS